MGEEGKGVDARLASAQALAAQVAAAGDGADEAREYLKKQTRLTDLQIENLQKQDEYETSHLRWRRISDQMSGALQFVAVAFGVLIVVAIGAAIWGAANANGLVIEAFSVPQDFASRGLSGQVVAAKLQDRLSTFESQTVSNRAPSSYANNWGDDIKVQIPDTGVSISELNRGLRSWLGHETHISGEVYRTPKGIAVTARTGAGGGATFEGSEADLDKLLGKAAEAVYQATQPYRYAVYLTNVGRTKEAEAAYLALIANGSPQDHAWADIGMSVLYTNRADYASARRVLDDAIALRPGFILAYVNLQNVETNLQHDEQALAIQRHIVSLGSGSPDPDISEKAWKQGQSFSQGILAGDVGDFSSQLNFNRITESSHGLRDTKESARENDEFAYDSLHDPAAAARVFAAFTPLQDPFAALGREANHAFSDLQIGKYSTMLSDRAMFETQLAKLGPASTTIIVRSLWPSVAYALALKGEIAAGETLIGKTPIDCITCLRDRGRIAMLAKDWRSADKWFALAVQEAPSPPFAYNDWGWALMAKGDYGGAIEKFAKANAKGPHFADPLEGWGEALIAQNRSDLALEKFALAQRYAPNWGRLELKWGEALLWLGRTEEAHKHFAAAENLWLTDAELKELVRVRGV